MYFAALFSNAKDMSFFHAVQDCDCVFFFFVSFLVECFGLLDGSFVVVSIDQTRLSP